MIPKRIAQTIVADVLQCRADRMIYRSRHRGLLAAYAAGHVDALAVLERLHPGIVDISSRNYCEITRTILGE